MEVLAVNSNEILQYMISEGLEYQMLLVLLYNRIGFLFQPIYKPILSIHHDGTAFSILDGEGYNVLSTTYQLPGFIVDKKNRVERRLFDEPEHLYGYVARYQNKMFGEIVYEKSAEKGKDYIRNAAFEEYIEIASITDVITLNRHINEAVQNENAFFSTMSNSLDSTVGFNVTTTHLFDLLCSKRLLSSCSKSGNSDLRIQLNIMNGVEKAREKFYRGLYISHKMGVLINDDKLPMSITYSLEFAPLKNISTPLTQPISIIANEDTIPDILYKIAIDIKANRLLMAVGYAFESGLELLAPAIFAVSQQKDRNIELLIGDLKDYDEYTKQKALNRNTAEKINHLISSSFLNNVMTYKDSFYHGKFYLIGNDTRCYIIVGSSNITSSAYNKNKELDVIFMFDNNTSVSPNYDEFIEWYNALKGKATILDHLDDSLFLTNCYIDEAKTKSGNSIFRSLTSDEERERYRLLESFSPSRIEETLFRKKKDFRPFYNYVVFTYEEQGISIIECFSYGNSCYVFSTTDIDQIQQIVFRKSKDQAQRSSYFVTCINHSDDYADEIKALF